MVATTSGSWPRRAGATACAPPPCADGPAAAGRGAEQAQVDLAGRRPEPGLLLLADLRRLHPKAAGLPVDWELLAHVPQGTKQRPRLELTQRCHPETLRQLWWTNAQLKKHAPRVLAS
ncbi:hypothetical protein ACVGOW_22430 [Pseudonocardia saturnea]